MTRATAIGMFLLAIGSAHAAKPLTLTGTFTARGDSRTHIFRGLPALTGKARFRVELLERDGRVAVHTISPGYDSLNSGKIVRDNTLDGERKVRIRYDRPYHAAVVQELFHQAALQKGMTPQIRIIGSSESVDAIVHSDGTISVRSTGTIKREKMVNSVAEGVFNRTIKVVGNYLLTPPGAQ
jgi:hypothetical protein